MRRRGAGPRAGAATVSAAACAGRGPRYTKPISVHSKPGTSSAAVTAPVR